MLPDISDVPFSENITINYCPEYCLIPNYDQVIVLNVILAFVIYFMAGKEQYKKPFEIVLTVFIAANLVMILWQIFGYLGLLNFGA